MVQKPPAQDANLAEADADAGTPTLGVIIDHHELTRCAKQHITESDVVRALGRMLCRDWGDVCEDIMSQNNSAFNYRYAAIFGRYQAENGTWFRVSAMLGEFRAIVGLDCEGWLDP